MPTYGETLVLFATHIRHDAVPRDAIVTYAVADHADVATAQQWADSGQSLFAARWASYIDDGAVITHTTALKGDGTDEPTIGDSTAVGTRGTFSGSKLPPNCAVLIKKRTALGGRKNRGRLYLPFSMNEGDVGEAGDFGGVALTQRQTAATAWLDDLNDGVNNNMVIANRVYDLPWDNPNRRLLSVSAGAAVTTLLVESVIATQRRRMLR